MQSFFPLRNSGHHSSIPVFNMFKEDLDRKLFPNLTIYVAPTSLGEDQLSLRLFVFHLAPPTITHASRCSKVSPFH